MLTIDVTGEALKPNASFLKAHIRLVMDALLKGEDLAHEVAIELREVHPLKSLFGLAGECQLPVGPWDGQAPVVLSLAVEAKPEAMLSTLTHELVHAKQVFRGEVYRADKRVVWAATPDEDYRSCRYGDEPWEREAFEVQEKYHGPRHTRWKARPPRSFVSGFKPKPKAEPHPLPSPLPPPPKSPYRSYEIPWEPIVKPKPKPKAEPHPLVPARLILPTPEETHKVTGLPPLPPAKPHSWSWEYYVQPVTFPKDLK